MLSDAKIHLIRSLATRKNRERKGRCLVEGTKAVEAAGAHVEFTFGPDDVPDFATLVTTETPQPVAAVARIPEWSLDDVLGRSIVVVLDGIQDPGNVGAILRLCQAFGAAMVAVESAEITNPKTVRSSAGTLFAVPWITASPDEAQRVVNEADRSVFRMERGGKEHVLLDKDGAGSLPETAFLILGSEGKGIRLPVQGTSLEIPHDPSLESLNVGHAAAIALYMFWVK